MRLYTARDCSRSSLNRRVRTGELVRVLPGVYADPELGRTVEARVAAVALWNRDAVVCGAAAARLTYAPRLRVEVVDVAFRTEARCAGFRFSRRCIPASCIRERAGLRFTAPALTALDLVPELGGDAIDDVLRARVVRLSDLWETLRECPGRPGNQDRARLLIDSRAEPWSAAERLAHRVLRQHRIAGWSANHPVLTPAGRYYLDIAFPGVRLAIEIDGRQHRNWRRIRCRAS